MKRNIAPLPTGFFLPMLIITLAGWPSDTSLFAAGQRSIFFRLYTQGFIVNPTQTTHVSTAIECAIECKFHQLVCSAFSIKEEPSSGLVECKISLGEFLWERDDSSRLFGENIGDLRGYHLGQDGYLYKFFEFPKVTAGQAKAACIEEEQGDVAVAYPGIKYNATYGTPGVQTASDGFANMGIKRTGNNKTSERWITDDGAVFNSNNRSLDTDQHWGPGEPIDGVDHVVVGHPNGTWEARKGLTIRSYICRRAIAKYIQSPINKVYYRASTEKLSQMAAQAECEKAGGTLALVLTPTDLNATEHFRSRQRAYSTGFFIAGNDNAQEGTWVLPDGTIISLTNRLTDPFQALFWDPMGPSNSTSENCLIMTYTGMTSATCDGPRRFLCQITLA